jgi:hypothetical protein
MKKLFYIFFMLFCYSNSYGQITIDSIFVYQTPGTDSLASTVDSIYFSGTHTGQVLKKVQVVSGLLNGSLPIILTFEGCDSVNTTFYDTTIVYGYYASSMGIFTKWDTIANCSYPTLPFYTDTLFWNIWGVIISTEDKLIDKKQVKVYPNPARDILKIEYSQGIRPRKIQLISINGAVIKSFEPNERLLNIQTIPSGFYFLKIEMEEGYVLTKKVIIE